MPLPISISDKYFYLNVYSLYSQHISVSLFNFSQIVWTFWKVRILPVSGVFCVSSNSNHFYVLWCFCEGLYFWVFIIYYTFTVCETKLAHSSTKQLLTFLKNSRGFFHILPFLPKIYVDINFFAQLWRSKDVCCSIVW